MDGPSLMKSEITIKALSQEYYVNFNDGFLTDNDKNCFYVVDEYFSEKFNQLPGPKMFLSPREENKSLETTSKIIEFLGVHGCTKAGVLVAVGGGITQDLCTLTASLYMRGIEWIYYPTTLASMIDSCIGGKSSINVGIKKNIVGNFYPPKKIVIDLNYIDSLSQNDICSGLLEGVKITFAKGNEEFRKFISAYQTMNFEEMIELALLSKKWFIEVDEYDVAERKLLNFGHTFGHAIESATNFKISHGVSVGLGMLAAIAHSNSFNSIHSINLQDCILNILDPIKLEFKNLLDSFEGEKFLKAFRSDKKHTDKNFNLILPDGSGLKLCSIEKSSQSEKEILKCVQYAIETVYAA